ncbi:transcriptional regulator [Paenibacillus pectinilyticus]|uniref:Transcriptional regulator n=1 Tax=Paenibacillus pectinilyticus TaxID=512399 RepID=A0A1C0ZUU3_9BACL|nr:MarR family transcriptional regulator [Paenibacillus pectinilyticus]OCT11875.1 transcriptional regulator [Paenibacillus pectinilyticus]
MKMDYEASAILYQLLCLNKQISPKFERCTGISPARLELLHLLFEVDEISQTVLQKEVHIDSAAITRHVQQMEVAGMVERRRNPEDQRVTFVKLTELGREKILAFRQEKEIFTKQLLKDFSGDDKTRIAELLSRMQDNIREL